MSPRVLVCGAGSIGRRHVGNLKRLGAEVLLWRARPELAAQAAEELGVEAGPDRAALLARADAVVVATAPDSHVEIARESLAAGKALFLEKPLAHDRTGVAALAEEARAAGVPIEIGCQLRRHPTLMTLARHMADPADGPVYAFQAAVGQRLDQWRPGRDHRDGFSADAARGGGALFELVHELDLVHWLCGPVQRLSAMLRTVSDLGIAADDLANLTLELRDGAVGQVQTDMLSPAYRRRLEIVRRHAVWRWDYVTGRLTRDAGEGDQLIDAPPEGFARNDLFLDHMRWFLSRLDDPTIPPACPLEDGIAVLDYALAARRASAEGRQIDLTPAADRPQA